LLIKDGGSGGHFASVSASNPAYLITGQHRQRHYATTHNVGDMKNNHMPNMAHGKNFYKKITKLRIIFILINY